MNRLINFLWLTILIITTSIAHYARADSLEQLDQDIRQIMEEHQVASVSYAIIENGQPTHLNTLGYANLESKTPALPSTPYRIASISKMVVGIAVMQLVESGQLKLNDEVKALVPDVEFHNPWSFTHSLKLIHLVENTTGWNDISLREFAFDNTAQLSLLDALAVNPASRTSRWPPGTRHAYTNSTAAVAALIVERVTGMTFENYAQQYIFAPLDITSASYDISPPKLATGYSSRLQYQPYKPVLMVHAGSLTMSVSDMSKLLSAFLSRNTAVLSASGYQRMEFSASTNVGAFSAGYGIFNYARFYDGRRFRGHDGALPGWRSELSYSPEHDLGFVVLQNTESNAAFRAVVNEISTYITQSLTSTHTLENMQPPKEAQGYYRYQNPRNQSAWFLERLISPYKLKVNTDTALISSLFPPGWSRTLYYDRDDNWRNEQGEIVAINAIDPVLGKVLHYGDRVFVKTNTLTVWIDKIVLVIWLVILSAMIPISIFWMVKLSTKKYSNRIQKATRLTTIFVTFSGALFLVFLVIGIQAPIPRLGSITVISAGLMLSSVFMALCTAVALYFYFKHVRVQSVNLANLVSSVLILCQSAVVFYLAWFGVIGIQTWV